jgi:hypothetical protein
MKLSLLLFNCTLYGRKLLPQGLCTLTTAVTDMEGNDLVSCGIHGNPDPLPVRFLPDKAPELV